MSLDPTTYLLELSMAFTLFLLGFNGNNWVR